MKKNSLIEGTIIASLAIIISKILGLLYVIPFYKIIGEDGGALYGYAYNIYNIFLVLSSAGIPLAISKITSEYEAKKQIEEKQCMFIMSQKIIVLFALVSFFICFAFSSVIAKIILGDLSGGNSIQDVSFVIKCVSFALLIVPLLSIYRGYLQGHNYIKTSSTSQVIEQFVRVIIIIIGSYIAVYAFHWPVIYAVGISLIAAFIGAIFGFLFLKIKCKKYNLLPNKESLKDIEKKDKKSIIKKIAKYCIPFIIINITNNLYNTIDMIFIIRCLNYLQYAATDIEYISSVFTIWADKIFNVVKAFVTGLTMNLIPLIVKAYVSKEKKQLNIYFNKSLQILFLFLLPIIFIMFLFAENVWKVFYTYSFYGPIILKYLLVILFFECGYLIMGSVLQGLYKNKLLYISVIGGFGINLLLDFPLMLLFNKLNIYPFYGAITATLFGYLFSLGLPLIYLKRKMGFNYRDTIIKVPKLVLSLLLISCICFFYKKLVAVPMSYFGNVCYLGGIGILCFILYFLINRKFIITIIKS